MKEIFMQKNISKLQLKKTNKKDMVEMMREAKVKKKKKTVILS